MTICNGVYSFYNFYTLKNKIEELSCDNIRGFCIDGKAIDKDSEEFSKLIKDKLKPIIMSMEIANTFQRLLLHTITRNVFEIIIDESKKELIISHSVRSKGVNTVMRTEIIKYF